MSRITLFTVCSGLSLIAASGSADAQQSGTANDTGASTPEIVVTAQKRAQSVNDVGITMVAVGGQELLDRGIASVNDLPRLVSGFTVQESAFNSTSLTLRGVGFFNSDLATPPAVSVYVDEAAIPYPAMTSLVAFDLERVEVLKGPQGTLYGQNATGGAVNYIAAKSGDHLAYGLDAGYGRFNEAYLGGFVSGPLTANLNARLALRGLRADGWQRSITRPGDKLGRKRQLQSRLTLDWTPSAAITSKLTIGAWFDNSDSLAGQLSGLQVASPVSAQPTIYDQPIVRKKRAADWTPGLDYARNNDFIQVSWRNDLELGNDVTLTALTSYLHFKTRYSQDFDGTPLQIYEVTDDRGTIASFSQELRLTGKLSGLTWMLGANYARDRIKDRPLQFFGDNSAGRGFLSCCGLVAATARAEGDTRVETVGIFGNVEYDLLEGLTAQISARYNHDKRRFTGCTYDVQGPLDQGGGNAAVFAIVQGALNDGSPPVPITAGQCFVLDPDNNFQPVGLVRKQLSQDNLSWKLGLNWKPVPRTLVYATLSRGYKAGTIPILGASLSSQFNPVPQESVLASEIGLKTSLFDRRVQLNLAGFHYAYSDKQLRGKVADPFFGALEQLVTIPKSRVSGVEAQVILRPIKGFTIDSSVTYVSSKIKQFTGFDSLGGYGNQKGTSFPFSPKWQSVTDASYEVPLSPDLGAFAGGTVTYNSSTNSGIGETEALRIGTFTVLDLRAGLDMSNGRYRVTMWAKNVTGKYRWTSSFLSFDTIARFLAPPPSYGVSLSAKF